MQLYAVDADAIGSENVNAVRLPVQHDAVASAVYGNGGGPEPEMTQ